MGLTDRLFPELKPRQVIYAGDRHCEVVRLVKKKIVQRRRIEGVSLLEPDAGRWPEIAAHLQPQDTGVVLNSDPFIFNFFEFDRLPWSPKLLSELVDWKLRKIFPENIEAYEHRFFRLNKKRIFSILVKKTLLEQLESLFREKHVSLIGIGSSTLETMNRLAKVRRPADFFVEIDDAGCCLVFQSQGLPVYIRKFRIGSRLEMAAEISKTVQFVKNSYGCAARSYVIVEHQQEAFADRLAAELAGENLSCRNADWAGKTPYIPGSQ